MGVGSEFVLQKKAPLEALTLVRFSVNFPLGTPYLQLFLTQR
jgi:hypothetical protein